MTEAKEKAFPPRIMFSREHLYEVFRVSTEQPETWYLPVAEHESIVAEMDEQLKGMAVENIDANMSAIRLIEQRERLLAEREEELLAMEDRHTSGTMALIKERDTLRSEVAEARADAFDKAERVVAFEWENCPSTFDGLNQALKRASYKLLDLCSAARAAPAGEPKEKCPHDWDDVMPEQEKPWLGKCSACGKSVKLTAFTDTEGEQGEGGGG